ncbi:hypothetical protein PHK61_20990 [Actinomycetospora lutea]|uniref:hypothetical protein n=1 Tax=Actinomycetospora lutea TaxID=663604 RepID=UPI0023670F36|nr:hypothetical protein [Actinomycetospora lutea]MDD7940904.1 hypothetical protein [Actinomycetospora lutea]
MTEAAAPRQRGSGRRLRDRWQVRVSAGIDRPGNVRSEPVLQVGVGQQVLAALRCEPDRVGQHGQRGPRGDVDRDVDLPTSTIASTISSAASVNRSASR